MRVKVDNEKENGKVCCECRTQNDQEIETIPIQIIVLWSLRTSRKDYKCLINQPGSKWIAGNQTHRTGGASASIIIHRIHGFGYLNESLLWAGLSTLPVGKRGGG